MKAKMSCILFGLLGFAGMLPVAEAHTLGADGSGVIAGLAHPFTGLDHWLAMIAVGIWAGQLAGKAVWRVPMTFTSTMMLGSILGFLDLSLPVLETTIASSVLIFGLMIAGSLRLSTMAASGLVGFFALFHGFAHGMELPQTASPILYGIGFVFTTLLLHCLGLGIAKGSRQYPIIQRILGMTLITYSALLLTT